jgi:hypothetical protein
MITFMNIFLILFVDREKTLFYRICDAEYYIFILLANYWKDTDSQKYIKVNGGA